MLTLPASMSTFDHRGVTANCALVCSSCLSTAFALNASLRRRPLPMAPRPSARYTRASSRSASTVFSISIQRDLLSRDRVRRLFERAGNLPDAVGWIVFRRPPDWIMIDDGLHDQRVVGVQPERLLLVGAPLLIAGHDRRRIERCDVAAQPAAIGLQRAVVHEPIAHVQHRASHRTAREALRGLARARSSAPVTLTVARATTAAARIFLIISSGMSRESHRKAPPVRGSAGARRTVSARAASF